MNPENLFIAKESDYGKNYKDHLFEQYKLYIESAEKISDRRQNANNYFITINTALFAIISLSFQVDFLKGAGWLPPLFSFIGVIICIIFWYLLRSYKQMNTGKYKVIHKIEKHLPLALYDFEWKILKQGKDRKVYYPFSHIELNIPWIFGIIYLALGIICILSK